MRGILLCGGQSRRMGQKKQWLTLGEKPLLLHQIETLEAVCDDIVVVVNEPQEQRRIEQLGIRTVPDFFSGQGPLAGLHAGLQGLAAEEQAMLVGCDLPFLSASVLRDLQREAETHRSAQAVVPADGEHLYPVCALYRGEVRALAEAFLMRQENTLRRFLAALNVQFIDATRWRNAKRPPFLNLNTPEDYLVACNLWQKEGQPKDE